VEDVTGRWEECYIHGTGETSREYQPQWWLVIMGCFGGPEMLASVAELNEIGST
jgi:hypothetical protein